MFHANDADLVISQAESWIRMNFPVFSISKVNLSSGFNRIMDINPVETYRSQDNWTVALVGSEREVIEAHPDFEGIRREKLGQIIAVTSRSDSAAYDFVVRVFCDPSIGINEDPVTGSINCILVPFWHLKLNKTSFRSKQLSKRTGELRLELKGNRVDILGQAKTVFTIDFED